MPDLSLEHHYNGLVVGIDEVGRGPLAGPVVAGCVYIPPVTYDLPFWIDVNDSKKLSAKRRDELAALIKAHTVWGIGQASVTEIDQINILQATFLAMRRAFEAIKLGGNPSAGWDPDNKELDPGVRRGCNSLSDHRVIGSSDLLALIDGNRAPPNFPCPVRTIIKGDQTSLSIAAASIIAKVTRDHLMAELARDYPAYGWDQNAGYGTTAHLAALDQYGPCPHHRRSFAPIKSMMAA